MVHRYVRKEIKYINHRKGVIISVWSVSSLCRTVLTNASCINHSFPVTFKECSVYFEQAFFIYSLHYIRLRLYGAEEVAVILFPSA